MNEKTLVELADHPSRAPDSSASRSWKALLLMGNDPEIRYLSWKAAPHVRRHPLGFLSSVKRTNADPVVTSCSWKNIGFNNIGSKASVLQLIP